MDIWRGDGLFHMVILDGLFPAAMGESSKIEMLSCAGGSEVNCRASLASAAKPLECFF